MRSVSDDLRSCINYHAHEDTVTVEVYFNDGTSRIFCEAMDAVYDDKLLIVAGYKGEYIKYFKMDHIESWSVSINSEEDDATTS